MAGALLTPYLNELLGFSARSRVAPPLALARYTKPLPPSPECRPEPSVAVEPREHASAKLARPSSIGGSAPAALTETRAAVGRQDRVDGFAVGVKPVHLSSPVPPSIRRTRAP